MDATVLPTSLKYATLGAFRCSLYPLKHGSDAGFMMRLWIAAASGLPDTDAVCEAMVDTLLEAAYDDRFRPHIPAEAWEWLKKRPVLPRGSHALYNKAPEGFFQTVRTLGDIEIIASYLSVVWSERSSFHPTPNYEGIQRLVRKELGGMCTAGYRADLIQRLDYVISRVGEWSAGGYREIREELLELEEESTRILAGMLPKVVTCFWLLTHINV